MKRRNQSPYHKRRLSTIKTIAFAHCQHHNPPGHIHCPHTRIHKLHFTSDRSKPPSIPQTPSSSIKTPSIPQSKGRSGGTPHVLPQNLSTITTLCTLIVPPNSFSTVSVYSFLCCAVYSNSVPVHNSDKISRDIQREVETLMGSRKSRGTMYSEEFQAMLDRLEEEDEYEEEEDEGPDNGGGRRRKMREEQVRALEARFEEEWRLSPARKATIAAELGLEPKQVAVWFQNRRSRCKTKQIEREFGRLRSVYEDLHHEYELLQQETNSLHLELKDLEAKAQAREEAMKGESTTIPNPQTNPCERKPSDNALSTASMSPATIEPLMSLSWCSMDDTLLEWRQLGGLAGGEGGSSSDTWDLYDLIR